MKTLYEAVTRHDFLSKSPARKEVMQKMDEAEIIHIQNVADYFWGSEQEHWKLDKDIPNLAPPFPVFWMEYTLPKIINAEGAAKEHPYAGMRSGFLFISLDAPENKYGIKWMVEIILFAEYQGRLHQSVDWRFAVDKDGQVPHFEDGANIFVTAIEGGEDARDAAWNHLVPALLAVSFMHCKNVDLVPRLPQVGNRKQRDRHAPRIKYHTLQIEPMKKVLREEGKAEETGIKHALHICRGHFKDFSKGKGLFGRYQGMYWWDSQVRGSGERGAVIKDYNVNEPP